MTVSFRGALLFVPATRPNRIEKAQASGADGVIVDLEDAVADSDKIAAREGLLTWLDAHSGAPVLLRVNAADTDWYENDLKAVRHPNVGAVVLPMADTASVSDLSGQLGKPILPLVETAKGVDQAVAIAALPSVAQLLIGTIDLALDLGLDADHEGGAAMLDMARFRVVIASARSGLAGPLDGVIPDFRDLEGLTQKAVASKAKGMAGMMCIHPTQVAPVTGAFVQSDAEKSWATRVLAAAKGQPGAFSFEGEMVDAPILKRAERILAMG